MVLILGSPLPLVLKTSEKKGDGVGKIVCPHGILQVVDEQHRSVQHVASPSPHLGARTRVVDEIVDGSILSLWRDRGKTTASADRCTCPNGSLKLNENFSVLHSSACVI